MKIVPFIAESAEDAVSQIRSQLGSEAVVLSVRQLDKPNILRFWTKPKIEVIACLPDPGEKSHPPTSPPPQYLDVKDDDIAQGRFSIPKPGSTAIRFESANETTEPFASTIPHPQVENNSYRKSEVDNINASPNNYNSWKIGALLENAGFLPRYSKKVVERLQQLHGVSTNEPIANQIQLTRSLLKDIWIESNSQKTNKPNSHQIFIGPLGSGKTTCICKRLVNSVLLENKKPIVWRLDNQQANTAEILDIYCEMFQIPVYRSISQISDSDLVLIDIPGVNTNDTAALDALSQQIRSLPEADILLAINAAYELHIQLAQIRAFSRLPISGLVFTHLDEEIRWGKLWNFLLGTNYPLRYLSTGQNIPGGFSLATADELTKSLFS